MSLPGHLRMVHFRHENTDGVVLTIKRDLAEEDRSVMRVEAVLRAQEHQLAPIRAPSRRARQLQRVRKGKGLHLQARAFLTFVFSARRDIADEDLTGSLIAVDHAVLSRLLQPPGEGNLQWQAAAGLICKRGAGPWPERRLTRADDALWYLDLQRLGHDPQGVHQVDGRVADAHVELAKVLSEAPCVSGAVSVAVEDDLCLGRLGICHKRHIPLAGRPGSLVRVEPAVSESGEALQRQRAHETAVFVDFQEVVAVLPPTRLDANVAPPRWSSALQHQASLHRDGNRVQPVRDVPVRTVKQVLRALAQPEVKVWQASLDVGQQSGAV
eukprot:scaffold146_cov265-Pinguiococcus_pyrenoidosus.AAC.38